MEKLVSVILPVGDEISYFNDAVESIVKQTYKNIEVLIIDSSQASIYVKEIIKPYGDKIRYIYQEKSGIANALNLGIKEARGYYIARMDADDISLPDRIAAQVDYLEANPSVCVLATEYDYIEKDGGIVELETKEVDYETVKAQLIFENPIAHPSIMFRTSLFESGWKYNNVYSEDLDLWINLAKSVKIEILNKKLLLYRRHAQNAVVTNVEKVIASSIASTRKYLSLLFGMNTDKYLDEDLTKNYYLCKLRGDLSVDICNYLLRQHDLLNEILKANRKLKVIDDYILKNEINRRWDLVTLLLPRFENVPMRNWNPNRVFIENDRDLFKYRRLNKSLGSLEVSSKDIRGYLNVNVKLREKFFAADIKFILYGLGELGSRTIKKYEYMKRASSLGWDLVGVADRNKLKFMLMEKEYETMTADELKMHEFDYIIISSDKFYAEIRDSLMEAGVEKEKILDNPFL